MAQSKIKIKIVEFVNGLMAGKPKQYKPALQTPTVVSAEKFIENIAKETGLSRFQASNVLSCIFQTAGDYMELGNAVQLHEDFGTLKPYIKVKAVSDKDKCNAECIQGMGLRLIPTGKMRNLLSKSQFVFTGMSSGGDVEDSEVVNPDPTPDPDPEPSDPSGTGGGTGEQNGGQNGEQTGSQTGDEIPEGKCLVTYVFADGHTTTQLYNQGNSANNQGNVPENTPGYIWSGTYTQLDHSTYTITEEDENSVWDI